MINLLLEGSIILVEHCNIFLGIAFELACGPKYLSQIIV